MFGRKEKTAGGDTAAPLLCGFDKRPCVRDRCAHWLTLEQKDAQTQVVREVHDCAFNAAVVIASRNAHYLDYLGAALDKVVNEQNKRAAEAQDLRRQLIEIARQPVTMDLIAPPRRPPNYGPPNGDGRARPPRDVSPPPRGIAGEGDDGPTSEER